jgi:hypothetical protein
MSPLKQSTKKSVRADELSTLDPRQGLLFPRNCFRGLYNSGALPPPRSATQRQPKRTRRDRHRPPAQAVPHQSNWSRLPDGRRVLTHDTLLRVIQDLARSQLTHDDLYYALLPIADVDDLRDQFLRRHWSLPPK